MKKKISLFLKTYFYYNNQEKKGIYTLLLLIFLVIFIDKLYSWFWPQPKVNYSIEELYLLDSTSNISFERKTFSVPKNNYPAVINSTKKVQPKPLNINHADSVELVRLYRIGPVLAQKIINYRNKLGGFVSLNQLTEIWGFDADILYDLDGKIFVEPKDAKLYNLNTVELDALKTHPYFKFKLSQAIVNYRKQHGNFNSLDDLRSIKIVNDSILNLIRPYCVFN